MNCDTENGGRSKNGWRRTSHKNVTMYITHYIKIHDRHTKTHRLFIVLCTYIFIFILI